MNRGGIKMKKIEKGQERRGREERKREEIKGKGREARKERKRRERIRRKKKGNHHVGEMKKGWDGKKAIISRT